jgi:hypothetical protein
VPTAIAATTIISILIGIDWSMTIF